MKYNYFELHRKIDDLVYQFDKSDYGNKIPGFCRRDSDLWITYRKNLGWVAFDEDTKEVQGLPWQVKIEDQNPNYPPEGVWVSKKGNKSYVYELIYKK